MKTRPPTLPGSEPRTGHAAGGVAHVHVGAPELLPEDLERPVGPEVASELVDREVEAHARGHAVHRREAQAGRLQLAEATAQQRLLDLDLLLGVQRDGRELAVLGDGHRRIGHAAVVGAGGGEDQAGATPASWARATTLRLPPTFTVGRDCRILGAGRVPDDGREMHDRVRAREGARAGGRITHVAADDLGTEPRHMRGNVFLAVQQRIQHTDVMAAVCELLDDAGSDVAQPSGHGYTHAPSLPESLTRSRAVCNAGVAPGAGPSTPTRPRPDAQATSSILAAACSASAAVCARSKRRLVVSSCL